MLCDFASVCRRPGAMLILDKIGHVLSGGGYIRNSYIETCVPVEYIVTYTLITVP